MLKTPIVAVVDDDESVCEGLVDLLSAMGLDAEAFPSAQDFLRSGRPDDTACLITDAQMPGMAGLDLIDRLARSGKSIPAILITAFPKELDRLRAERAGVHCYLAKPFSEAELLSCIRSALKTAEGP
jgi:FixJ family two-component response regulator